MGKSLCVQKKGGLTIDNNEKKKKKAVWSYSRVACFDHCPYEFYLNYIVRDDDLYLSEGNFYAELGSYTHEILAMIFNGTLPIEDAAQYFVDHYDENVFYTAPNSIMHKATTAIIDYLANMDLRWLNKYEILGVEMRQEFEVENVACVGIIDLLLRDKEDNKIVIMDHKSTEYPFTRTGSVKKKLTDSFAKYKMQMYLYAKLVFEKYGEFPKEMTWHHFKDGGKLATIPFKPAEYVDVMTWFVNTVQRIGVEETFDAHPEFFYCTRLCNFRHSCEYCASEFGG